MTKITLFKSLGCIMSAQTIDGRPDPTLIQYCGTHIMPTAWTDQADMNEVKAKIQALNPGCEVTCVS